MVGDGVSHGREPTCSLACCGHHAMQFTKCHTTAMSFSVLVSIFSVWLQMVVPMSQASIQVFLCTASLRRQLCHFRIQIALGWNWLSRVEMQSGMVGGCVGFLVAGLWEGVRGIIEKMIFDQLFLHVAAQCRFTSLLLLWRFLLFFTGPRRSRTSQMSDETRDPEQMSNTVGVRQGRASSRFT